VDGQWHHLAGVRDAALGNVKLYLDGALVASATDSTTGTFTLAAAQDRIGSRPVCPTPMFFNGLIDEVEVYRRALSGWEVQALFNAGSAGKCKCNFDVDDNGQLDALTDGLMIIRAGLGLTGPALTQGTIGPNANRTNPTAVLDFINANKLTGYDLDGNGTFDAVTDGLMILRYLFRFDGAAVVTGAVGSSATRTDWNAVNAFLASGCDACRDGIKDLSETDIDCGGPACGACAVGKKCLANSDCQTLPDRAHMQLVQRVSVTRIDDVRYVTSAGRARRAAKLRSRTRHSWRRFVKKPSSMWRIRCFGDRCAHCGAHITTPSLLHPRWTTSAIAVVLVVMRWLLSMPRTLPLL